MAVKGVEKEVMERIRRVEVTVGGEPREGALLLPVRAWGDESRSGCRWEGVETAAEVVGSQEVKVAA